MPPISPLPGSQLVAQWAAFSNQLRSLPPPPVVTGGAATADPDGVVVTGGGGAVVAGVRLGSDVTGAVTAGASVP